MYKICSSLLSVKHKPGSTERPVSNYQVAVDRFALLCWPITIALFIVISVSSSPQSQSACQGIWMRETATEEHRIVSKHNSCWMYSVCWMDFTPLYLYRWQEGWRWSWSRLSTRLCKWIQCTLSSEIIVDAFLFQQHAFRQGQFACGLLYILVAVCVFVCGAKVAFFVSLKVFDHCCCTLYVRNEPCDPPHKSTSQ